MWCGYLCKCACRWHRAENAACHSVWETLSWRTCIRVHPNAGASAECHLCLQEFCLKATIAQITHKKYLSIKFDILKLLSNLNKYPIHLTSDIMHMYSYRKQRCLSISKQDMPGKQYRALLVWRWIWRIRQLGIRQKSLCQRTWWFWIWESCTDLNLPYFVSG